MKPTSLNEIPITQSARESLASDGILTLEDVCRMTIAELAKTPKVGPAAVRIIANALDDRGMSLKGGLGWAASLLKPKEGRVSSLPIPNYVRITLAKAGILSIDDLTSRSRVQLLMRTHLGTKGLQEVERALHLKGLRLLQDPMLTQFDDILCRLNALYQQVRDLRSLVLAAHIKGTL